MTFNQGEHKNVKPTPLNMDRLKQSSEQGPRAVARFSERKQLADDKAKASAAKDQAQRDQWSARRDASSPFWQNRAAARPIEGVAKGIKAGTNRKSGELLALMGKATQGQRSTENGSTSGEQK